MLLLMKQSLKSFSTSTLQAKATSTKFIKHVLPSESIRERLIRLGIERKNITLEQKLHQKKILNSEKIIPGQMFLLKSALEESDFPRHNKPEIAFIGRSNVGKSSLINLIANSRRAVVSKMPGQTRSIDFYSIEQWFCLVDMPGYGYALAPEELTSKWPELIMNYLVQRRNLKRLYLLLDARHGLKIRDREFIGKLDQNSIYFQTILTKCDLANPKDLAERIAEVEKELFNWRYASRNVLLSSIYHCGLKTELRKEFIQMGLIPSKYLAELKEKMRNSNLEASNSPKQKNSNLQASNSPKDQ